MKYKFIKGRYAKKLDLGRLVSESLLDEESYDNFSVNKVTKITDQDKFGYNTKSDILYYVLEGKGTFFVDDDELKVEKGDAVFIPKNTKYRDTGGITLLAICCPRFKRENNIKVE